MPSVLGNALEEVWKSCVGPSQLDDHGEVILAEVQDLMPKEIDQTPLIDYAADCIQAL